jgi:hypothetical protein
MQGWPTRQVLARKKEPGREQQVMAGLAGERRWVDSGAQGHLSPDGSRRKEGHGDV